MAGVPEWLKKLTDEYSTDRFSPEYDEFNYNHLFQGVVALWTLGASEEHCRRFAEYRSSRKLEPAEVGKESVETGRELLSETTLKELLGKRKRFNDLVAHFRQRLVDLGNDRDLLLNTELPALLPGIATGALHGTIQLGYGYIADDERGLCDGLAYIHFAYCPFVLSDAQSTDKGNGDTDFFDLLKELKEDGQIMKFADDKRMSFNDGRDRSKFATRVLTLLTLKGDELVKLANRIKLPSWFDKGNFNADQLKKLSGWILDQNILMFCQSERGSNFYLIHGVTSAWAFAQMLPLLTDPHQALRAIDLFLASLLAAYLSIQCPAMSMENLKGVEDVSWEEILGKSVELEKDEHVYKVVQVCYFRSKENLELAEICRNAANRVTFHKFTYL